MITYHPRKRLHNQWTDVALNGERIGYYYKETDSDFYSLSLNEPHFFMKAYLTEELVKNKIEEILGSVAEPDWKDIIE